jgi:hypothetical protein
MIAIAMRTRRVEENAYTHYRCLCTVAVGGAGCDSTSRTLNDQRDDILSLKVGLTSNIYKQIVVLTQVTKTIVSTVKPRQ